MPAPPQKSIVPKWQCGMGEKCTNHEKPGETPGVHSGENGYQDAHDCVRQGEPAGMKRLNQR